MHHLQFISPVRISFEQQIKEIDGVDEALDFLLQWPVGRRGPVYHCALNCCHAAISAQLSAEDVHKSFESFAHITGILVSDAPHPATIGTEDKPKPLTK